MLPEAPPALPACGGGFVAAPTINIFNFWKDFLCRKNLANPLKKLENIALKEDSGKLLQKIIREYAAYYLDASDLKSEKLIQP